MIEFVNQDVDFKLENESARSDWISNAIKEEGKTESDLTYVFCNDDYILRLNKEHLNHDYFTDIITFNYNNGNLISGDFFISLDTVKTNAIKFESRFQNELDRVIIHGVLHLLGYDDKTDEQQAEMSAKEDYYLNLRPF